MSRSRAFALAVASSLVPGLAVAAGDGSVEGEVLVRVINVALLLGVLWWVARKPIQAYFAERRDGIRGEVEAAAKLRAEAEERHARFQRKLADLDSELESIRNTARDRAEAEKLRIIEDARAAAERIRSDARAAVDQELRRAREELRKEASELSIELAGDLLRNQIGDADRARLVDEFIAEVERPGSGSGS